MNPRNSRSGQALLMATLSLTVLFGTISFAVDTGWAYYRREAAQAAADSAAIAVVKSALSYSPSSFTCGSSKVWCGSPAGTATDCPAAAPGSASTSFDNGCMLAGANGFTTSGNRRVNIQANSTSAAPTVTGVTTQYWAVVKVSETSTGFFGSLIGSSLKPTARATAAVVGGSGGGAGCIYVLDPTANDAFNAGNAARVTSACGIYVASSAHGAQEAMHVTGSAFISAPSINLVGSYKQDNGGGTNIAPATGATFPGDPFSTVAGPTPAGSCQAGNFTNWQPSQYTPSPGTYCTFQLGNGMNAQLQPGTYIINGGSFSVQGGSALTAAGGVFIYLTGGATVNIANGASVTLSPLSSGTYQGILFYQDRSMSSPGTSNFAGGSNMHLSGSLYFPKALLNIDNGNNTQTMAIVSGRLNFQGGANIVAATSVSQTGISPGTSASVVMIE